MAVTSDDPPGMGRTLVRGEERKRIGKKKKLVLPLSSRDSGVVLSFLRKKIGKGDMI